MNIGISCRALPLSALLSLVASPTVLAQPEATAGQDTVTTEATPLEAPKKPSLLIFQFKGNAVNDAIVRATMDFTAGSFARTDRFELMTMDDVATLLELEATKASVGCDDESCMAELAGAVGADFIVAGKISKLGKIYAINVSILDPTKAKVIGLETVKASALENIPAVMDRAALRLTHRAFGEPIPDELKPKKRKRRRRRVDDDIDREPNTFGTILMYAGTVSFGVCVAVVLAGLAATGVSAVLLGTSTTSGVVKQGSAWVATIALNSAILAIPFALIGAGVAGVGWLLE